MRRISLLIVLGVGFVLCSERPALAYFDPATGGLILQAILGGIAGCAVLVRLYWRRLVSRFKGSTGDQVAE